VPRLPNELLHAQEFVEVVPVGLLDAVTDVGGEALVYLVEARVRDVSAL
jgi:hypothetical protein